MLNKLKKTRAGFTLVELIVVIAILAILAGVAIPVYSGYIKKANQAADNSLLAAVNTAFAAACLDSGFNAKDVTSAVLKVQNKKITGVSSVSVPSDKIFLAAEQTEDGYALLGAHSAQLAKTFSLTKFQKSFDLFFGDNSNVELKYFDAVIFDRENGTFAGTTEGALAEVLQESWTESSFSSEDGSIEQELLGMFDDIQAIFGRNAGLLSLIVDGSANNPMLSQLVSDLGIDGLNNAMNLSDEELQSIVAAKAASDPDFIPGYASMSEEEKAAAVLQKALDLENTIKGNSAILQVANDATGRTAADINSSLGGMMEIMSALDGGMISDEEFDELLYEAYPDFDEMSTEDQDNAVAAIEEELATVVISLGGFDLTKEALMVAQSAMAENTTLDDGGVSTLGALFALTQGFYSDPNNYTGEKPAMNGGTHMLEAVFSAISDEGFGAYYAAHGEADITAYLDAMSVMAAHSSEIDLTSSNAFSDQYSFLANILGLSASNP